MVIEKIFLWRIKISQFFCDQNIPNKNNTYDDQGEIKPNVGISLQYDFLISHKELKIPNTPSNLQYKKIVPFQILLTLLKIPIFSSLFLNHFH